MLFLSTTKAQRTQRERRDVKKRRSLIFTNPVTLMKPTLFLLMRLDYLELRLEENGNWHLSKLYRIQYWLKYLSEKNLLSVTGKLQLVVIASLHTGDRR